MKAEREDRAARDERHAPTPARACVVRRRPRVGKRGARRHASRARAKLAPGRVMAVAIGGRVFADRLHAAAAFAAGRDVSQRPQRDERGGRPEARPRIGGQQAERECRCAYAHQHPEERRLDAAAFSDA
ncbi:hypothetical protein [Burkholderia pseudomallei]|uniref:hypothetical protein n=2 Tax=Burkholderia pseudomallei TaxID=28450 RepID=UPI001416F8E9|nr:hypothetical protein [Burkholderia pseudomallei]